MGWTADQAGRFGKRLDSRALAGEAFPAVLAGRPNAGKLSLFNAPAGAEGWPRPLFFPMYQIERPGTRLKLRA